VWEVAADVAGVGFGGLDPSTRANWPVNTLADGRATGLGRRRLPRRTEWEGQ